MNTGSGRVTAFLKTNAFETNTTWDSVPGVLIPRQRLLKLSCQCGIIWSLYSTPSPPLFFSLLKKCSLYRGNRCQGIQTSIQTGICTAIPHAAQKHFSTSRVINAEHYLARCAKTPPSSQTCGRQTARNFPLAVTHHVAWALPPRQFTRWRKLT